MRRPASSGLWSRLFRLTLRAHPPGWRARYGREAAEAFEVGMARRREGSGAAAARRYAARAVLDALAAGWRERRVARGARGGAADSILVDLRNAARRLARAPGLSATVVAILALGVGANGAVFSVLRSAVLAPLPFPEADRLVLPRWTTTSPPASDTVFGQWSYPKFVEFREGSGDVFDGLAGYASRSAALTDPGDAESVLFEFVTPGYFEVLGVAPVLGRFFAPGEEGADAPPGVAVISHGFWVERFGSDPGAIGRTVTADGSRLEIVGVAPEGFRGLTGTARLWIPLGQARQAYGSWATDARGSHWFHALGRLAPGVGAGMAEARVASLADEIEAVDPTHVLGEDVGIDMAPLADVWSNRDTRASVWLAMAAAILILTIAVANVAALLMARGRRESRETAVRLALGAPRGRLLRERLAEGTLLALAGGAAGVLVAGWVVGWLRGIIPEHLFRGAAGDVLLVGSSG
ncbi:MAG: ABC transporter permease, partial [Gemmatimonadota bacterium]